MFTELNQKKLDVLEPFFRDPELEVSVRELSRRSEVSPGWVSKIVEELVERRIMETEESSASKTISTGPRFRLLKRIYNLDALFETGLVELLEDELRPDAVVLFGSYEKGEDTEKSDIDIAIINGRDKELDLSKFEKELNRAINLQNLEEPDKGDQEFRNSIANGTVLTGFLKVV